MTEVIIYTDGACSPNPGPGGWGVILVCNGVEKEISGGVKKATNNQMELMAAIEALRALTRPCKVELYTDSQYLQKGMTQWVNGWQKNGWTNSKGDDIKNIGYWTTLIILSKPHQIDWLWVKGHDGNEMNERVDQLAYAAIP